MNSASLSSICAVAWWHEKTGPIRKVKEKRYAGENGENGVQLKRLGLKKIEFLSKTQKYERESSESYLIRAPDSVAVLIYTSIQCNFFSFDLCQNRPKELLPRMNSKL